MPAASLPDPGLMFLYLCLVNSDMTKINYEAVGAAAGLKVPAARMRYSRLKKQIESGLVDGKLNLSAGAGPDEQEDGDEVMAEPMTPSPSKKRKVAPKAGSARKKVKAKGKGAQLGDAEEENEDGGVGIVNDEEMGDA